MSLMRKTKNGFAYIVANQSGRNVMIERYKTRKGADRVIMFINKSKKSIGLKPVKYKSKKIKSSYYTKGE